jgi:cytochrome P450
MPIRLVLARRRSLPPGERFASALGFFRAWRRDPLALLERLRAAGDVTSLRMPPALAFVLFEPAHIRQVLEAGPERYWKGDQFARLRRRAGDGMVFAEGETWRRARRAIVPVFRRQSLAEMADPVLRAAQALADRLRDERAPLEITHETARFALDVVAGALIGAHPRAANARELIDTSVEHAQYLLDRLVPLPLFLPTSRNRRFRRATREARELARDLIERGRDAGAGPLLAALLRARDAGEIDDRQIEDQVLTFFGAGTETTAMALGFTLREIAAHPAVEHGIRAELAREVGARDPGAADLPRLRLLRQALQEALRLYPPAWILARQARVPDRIGGYRLPRHAVCFMSPWAVHRHPKLWDEPERFDPARFDPERDIARPRYAYFPFGGGARGCIGEPFAMQEALLGLAVLLRRVRFELVSREPLRLLPGFTLHAAGGLWLRPEPV